MPALCILLVEDDASTKDAFTRFLARRHRVISVRTAEGALVLARTARFDLIISDLGLPGASGWELLPLIKAVHPAIKSMAISGYGYAHDLEKSKAVGFDRHLTKPVTAEQLKETIGELFPGRDLTSNDR